MKIIVLGDTHGRDYWKKIITKESYDKVIFIGDYFDSHDPGSYSTQQILNFREIIKFKKENSDKVILLLGNHDFHYLPGINEHYSGYQSHASFDIQEILKENLELLQVCHIENNFLFVHAGITNTWLKLRDTKLEEINDLLKTNYSILGFTPGRYYDPYGDEICQSPIWVRPDSLYRDKIEGYHQVVGHTTQLKGINLDYTDHQTRSFDPNVKRYNVILVDALTKDNFPPQYLVIENDIPKVVNFE